MAKRNYKKILDDGITPNPKYRPGGKRPTKYLPNGEINPKWKPRSGGKKPTKYLPNGEINPKWKFSANAINAYNERINQCKIFLTDISYEADVAGFNKFDKLFQRKYSKIIDSSPQLTSFKNFILLINNIRINGCGGTRNDNLDTVLSELNCLNCDSDLSISGNYLFCSELCQQEAQLVRYARKTIVDGRVWKSDVQEDGIGTRLLMLSGGGYPYIERSISKDRRQYVFERDKHICQICGNPGTEIDHINGSSNDPDNLQVVCKSCNIRKIKVQTITPESDPERWKILQQQYLNLATRVASDIPLKLCDDANIWNKICNKVRSIRKFRLDRGLVDT